MTGAAEIPFGFPSKPAELPHLVTDLTCRIREHVTRSVCARSMVPALCLSVMAVTFMVSCGGPSARTHLSSTVPTRRSTSAITVDFFERANAGLLLDLSKGGNVLPERANVYQSEATGVSRMNKFGLVAPRG